jgi:Domain of unknown function (DUF2017)
VVHTRFRRRRSGGRAVGSKGGRPKAAGAPDPGAGQDSGDRSAPSAVALTVEPSDAVVLRGLFVQLQDLVSPPDDEVTESDPLARMVGIGTATQPPEDPVLARLFPDAYLGDDEAASEFRRYTEHSLRERKQGDVALVLATLDDPGRERTLSEDEAAAWLGALNDLRLALGTRLEVTEDVTGQLAEIGPDDPRVAMWAVYHWVTELQETLVRCLM